MTRLFETSLFFLLAVGTLCAAGPPSVVSARTVLATDAVHPGTTVKVAVLARVEPGYHINAHKPSLDYLIPTQVTFADSPSFKLEKVVYPRGKMKKFVFLDSPILVYEGDIRLGAILRVGHSLKPGTYPLQGKFAYQACNDHACLPPTSVSFETQVRVVASSVPLKPANSEIFKKAGFD